MKKLVLILFTTLFFNNYVCANFNDVLVADIQYDWIDKSVVERETMIDEVRDIIFQGKDSLIKKEALKNTNKDILKDKERINHYMAAAAGYKEYDGYNISAFYYKDKKYIYMYGLQNKNDPSKSYYYDALGHLQYIDFIEGDYPEYPYYAIQYRISGKPVSAIYYASKDTQYLYEPDGKFKGLWYKHNMYDKHAKVILKRTAY